MRNAPNHLTRSCVLGVLLASAGLIAACSASGSTASSSSTVTETAPGESGPTPGETPAQSTPAPQAELIEVEQLPGDPRDDSPSALDDRNDPSFPAPLVDPEFIRSGGPPPDGIPPIDEPNFEVARSVTWLDDNEPVVLVTVDGETRGYPVQILTWHEIVNDTIGSTPISVSYCPLCNSALTYIRSVDDRVLDFGTSGSLFNSSLVMYDRQTESLWTHFDARAVVGTLTGTMLDTVPTSMVSWAQFKDANPDALVLSRDTGYLRDYGRNPYPGYDDINQHPFLFDGELDDRLPAQARVVALRGETESVVIPLDIATEAGVTNVELDGNPLVVLHAPGTASALDSSSISEGRDVGTIGVFVAELDGEAIELEAQGDGRFVDADGSTFDVLGIGQDGPAKGAQLEPVEHLDTFWFAIAAFEPDANIAE